MLGELREDLRKGNIEAGNIAAHGGNMALHKVLIDTNLCTVPRGRLVFRKLYLTPYESLPIWPPILLRTVNLHATYTTINDGEGVKNLRAQALTHVNALFALWRRRKDVGWFESNTAARLELSLLEKVSEKIVATRHTWEREWFESV